MDRNFQKIKILIILQYFNLDPKEIQIVALKSIIDYFVLYKIHEYTI